MHLVYTDTSLQAGWRQTVDSAPLPWTEAPSFCRLHGFDLKMIQADFMHTFHLGCARDLIGSCIKLMTRKRGIFSGATISKRLNQLFTGCKLWARQHGKQVGIKRLRQKSLQWSEYPEFKGKAADAAVFLPYLLSELQDNPIDGPYSGLLGVLWAAEQLSHCIMSSGIFLSLEEKSTIETVGRLFLDGYGVLASIAVQRREKYFKMRPKFHVLQHMIEDDRPSRRGPGWDHTFMDEDHVKACIRMLSKVSHRTAEKNLLLRNCIQVKQTVLRALQGVKSP